MALHKTIWWPAIIQAQQSEIMTRGSLEGLPATFLPQMPPFTFIADPFGLWHRNKLYIFTELYDYWHCKGEIYVFVYDHNLRLLEHGHALCRPWHLSYPYVFEADHEIWMLPEAWKSGHLTLYRAEDFPYHWREAFQIPIADPSGIPIDATPYFYDGLWWLFYSPQRQTGPVAELHIAYAETLKGPWYRHPQNPICRGKKNSRPGGTPYQKGTTIILPIQDCSQTYGGALRSIYFEQLTTQHAHIHYGDKIKVPASFNPFTDGFHTLSAAGDITLIDLKYRHYSLKGLALELRRWFKKDGN